MEKPDIDAVLESLGYPDGIEAFKAEAAEWAKNAVELSPGVWGLPEKSEGESENGQ